MAAFYLYTFNLIPHSHSPSSSNPDSLSNLNSISAKIDKRRSSCRTSGFTVLSTHSNPRILKSNRRSRYGQVLSPYDTDDNAGMRMEIGSSIMYLQDEDSETEEFDADRKNLSHRRGMIQDKEVLIFPKENWMSKWKNTIGSSYHTFNKSEDYDSSEMHGIGKLKPRKSTENKYCRLSEEIDLDEKCFPLLDYLSTFGLKESHFIQIHQKNYFEAATDSTVYSGEQSEVPCCFLVGLGIPDSRIGHVIAAAPSLFSYSVENSLKPTKNDLGKVVQLSPQILVQRIDNSWAPAIVFSQENWELPDSIVKMDGFLPRINFLRSIGMRNSDILKVVTNLTQVLSLSLEDNLKPKYMYLVNELEMSLSLDQRINPRHRFLVSLKKAPKGPFPLSSFVPTDECFCQQWAGTSLDSYLAFRQRLLLKDFAKKYEKRR
ncbi:hypothetical protein AAG906_035350 [Vitis piasezkii]